MLSAETAIGAHPVAAVDAAARICLVCEVDGASYLAVGGEPDQGTGAVGIAYAATALAEADLAVAAIACYTRSGRTATMLSALRPRVPIHAFSPDEGVVRRLAMIHGVVPHACGPDEDGHAGLDWIATLLADVPGFAVDASVVLVASTADPGTGPDLLEVRRLPRTSRR